MFEESWLYSMICLAWMSHRNGSKHFWGLFSDYRMFKHYGSYVSVVNDLAVRGMHLITEFAGKYKREREAMLQVIEQAKKLYPNFSKTTLPRLRLELSEFFLFMLRLYSCGNVSHLFILHFVFIVYSDYILSLNTHINTQISIHL